MITRKLGKILRGQATPFQLVAACVLGALLGFAPGFLQAPALYALLLAALLVTNANLGLALLSAGLMRLVALLALPVSFEIGRFLLDGPTSGLARAAVNAPILAWCGLERYAVAGGLPLGFALGLAVGLLLARAVTGFRRRMAKAGDDPSRWRELTSKPGARFAIWLFFGGTGKKTWEEKLARRVGNPIRTWGAALVVVLLVGAWFAHGALAGPLARRGLHAGLEEANGATVDVGPVELDLREGRFAVSGLALADPDRLDRDLFRADLLEADVDQVDFLRRRVHVAKLVVSEARSGATRETPGERIETTTEKVIEKASGKVPDPRDLTLEQVLKGYETWKERLALARRWLDRLSGVLSKEAGPETFAERLEREAREGGWFAVQAGHLVDEAPTFRLSELVVDGLRADWLPEKVFDLRGSEISTHPGLVDAPPKLSLASRDGSVRFEVDLAPVSRGGGTGALKVAWKGLSVDDAMGRLKLPGPAPLRGGSLDLEIDGSWSEGRIGWVDLPLRATVRDTTLAMEGIEPTRIDSLALPIEIRGSIDAPRIRFDRATFADALAKAGKDEIARRVREKLGAEVGEKLGELEEKTGVKIPTDLGKAQEEATGLLKGILEKKKKDG